MPYVAGIILAWGFLSTGCHKTHPQNGAEPTVESSDPVSLCLDRETRAAGLNRFGDPPETVYAGGSPLFDEATGRTVARLDYIARKHPALAAKCRRAR